LRQAKEFFFFVQLISRVTLNNLEVDAGVVYTGNDEGFKMEAVFKLPGDIGQMVTDPGFVKFCRELLVRGQPLVINDTKNVKTELSQYSLFSEDFTLCFRGCNKHGETCFRGQVIMVSV